MSKAIVEKVAAQFELTKKLAGEVVAAVFAGLADEIATGEKVRISGVGTFSTAERAGRTGRNPQTGEAVEIAAKTVVKFKAATALKERV